MKTNRKVVLIVSDIHSGYRFGLCNPDTLLDDGISDEKYNPQLGKMQELLWSTYQYGLEQVFNWAGKNEIIFLFLGDMTHGNKHLSEQMTTRIADQQVIAYYNFLPILENKKVQKSRFIVGTAAHNFGEGSSDYLVSLMLKETYPKKDIKALYHGRFNVDGVIFDTAHHGPGPGRFVANQGNAARSYLRDRMTRDIQEGLRPADIYLRGHYHEYIKEFLRFDKWESYLYICPPLCMPGDWTRQAIASPPNINFGLIAMEIINGQMGKDKIIVSDFDLRIQENL